MNEQQWLFLAPRSNETSRENFAATLASGYPIEEIDKFLTPEEKKILGSRKVLYIWGNQQGKKDSWNKMKIGDFVAFYATREFVYVGKCILKKKSTEIAHQLWGNVPGKEFTWEYVFFLDELRPISIPLEIIRELSGYKEKMVVQGFMPINEKGMNEIINTYGSLNSFFDNYSQGLSSKDVFTLDNISNKENLNEKEITEIDEITRDKDIDLLLAEWEQRKNNESPETIEKRVKTIKRNVSLVKQMKEKFKNECQVCGFTFKQKNGNLYSEVAHIEPISTKKQGIDTPSNMIVLCPNHHKMLDLGNLEIISKEEYSINGEKGLLKHPLYSIKAEENIKN